MSKFDHKAKTAFIILCITLIVCGVGFRAGVSYLNIWLEKKPVDLREHFATIPKTIGPWQAVGEDIVLDAATVEELDTHQYLDRYYGRKLANGEQQLLRVHLAYYTGIIDAIPHVPDRCMEAHGMEQRNLPHNVLLDIDYSKWPSDPSTVHRTAGQPYRTFMYAHRVTGQPVRVHMPIGDLQLRVTEFGEPGKPDTRIFAGYFFVANGQTSPSPGGVKKHAFEPREPYAYYCKLQYMMIGDEDLTEEKFVEVTSEFVQLYLPHVMACLPDWPEVEARSEQGATEQSGDQDTPQKQAKAE